MNRVIRARVEHMGKPKHGESEMWPHGDEGMSPHTDTLDMHLAGWSAGVKTQRNVSNKIKIVNHIERLWSHPSCISSNSIFSQNTPTISLSPEGAVRMHQAPLHNFMVLALFFLLKTLLPSIHLLWLRCVGGSSWSDIYHYRGRVIKWFSGALWTVMWTPYSHALNCPPLHDWPEAVYTWCSEISFTQVQASPSELEHPACLSVFLQTPSSEAETHSWILSWLSEHSSFLGDGQTSSHRGCTGCQSTIFTQDQLSF